MEIAVAMGLAEARQLIITSMDLIQHQLDLATMLLVDTPQGKNGQQK